MSVNLPVTSYETLVFDCDGVVLNSNEVKTCAFYQAALPYGELAANALVAYHTANGGISRYKKFAHFIDNIVPMLGGQSGPDLDQLLARYATGVREGLLTCEVAPALRALRETTPEARWMIVSGGDQSELREVFTARGLATLFDGGIYGSPDTKDEILRRERSTGNISMPALFIGDSQYDYRAADAAGLDFVFLSGWSEVENCEAWCEGLGIPHHHDVAALLSAGR
ncbi:HAD family hydrolase [Metapseudomonas otitidis]|uniref:HAD family hydrolase n=1 Tax=Metapseudomonas otitidis TaxID=319939 RepID=UPI001F100FE5|nr:HAD family hydrolase [Pseudomonas otitidis]